MRRKHALAWGEISQSNVDLEPRVQELNIESDRGILQRFKKINKNRYKISIESLEFLEVKIKLIRLSGFFRQSPVVTLQNKFHFFENFHLESVLRSSNYKGDAGHAGQVYTELQSCRVALLCG